jgi:excisionase family DNA binding protein
VNELPHVLTVEEAAEVLRISRGSAYEAIRTNAIPHVRIGRTIRVPRAALLQLLQEDPAGDATDHVLPSGPLPSERTGLTCGVEGDGA